MAIDFVLEAYEVCALSSIKECRKPASRSEERRDDCIASSQDTTNAQTTALELEPRNVVISQGLQEREKGVKSRHMGLRIGGN